MPFAFPHVLDAVLASTVVSWSFLLRLNRVEACTLHYCGPFGALAIVFTFVFAKERPGSHKRQNKNPATHLCRKVHHWQEDPKVTKPLGELFSIVSYLLISLEFVCPFPFFYFTSSLLCCFFACEFLLLCLSHFFRSSASLLLCFSGLLPSFCFFPSSLFPAPLLFESK